MTIQSILNDNSFQIAIMGSLIFLIMASPPLFKYVDIALAKILGKGIGKNYYIALFIHAAIVGILIFLFVSYILKPIYKILTTNNDTKSDDTKSDDKPKNILENFSVGGKMTCGGGK